MSNQYTVDYFIAKFEAIPEEKWTTHSYGRNGNACALGHCGAFSDEARALIRLLGDSPDNSHADSRVAKINDGEDPRFQQPTPKARILAALRSLKT